MTRFIPFIFSLLLLTGASCGEKEGDPANSSGKVAVTGVTLQPTLSLPVAGNAKLTASILPADATDKSVTWSRLNGTGSVTVDAEGNVTGEGEGTATVTATTVDGGFRASCTVTVTSVPDAAGKYYFSSSAGSDSNSGKSPSSPWLSLSKINTTAFAPGDTIFLKSGDMWSSSTGFSFTGKLSGSVQNPIVITSYGAGNKPNIRSTGGEAALGIHDTDNLHIKNLDIGPSSSYGLLLKDTDGRDHSGIRIENVDFHDMPDTYPGIYFTISGTYGFTGVDVAGCTATRTGYLFATQGNRDLNISDCRAVDCAMVGISLVQVTGGTIDNCYVSGCGTISLPQGSCGIFLGIVDDILITGTEVCNQHRHGTDPDAEAIDFERDCYNVTVRDCYLHDNDGCAIMFFDSGSPTQVNRGCVIENNVFENNSKNAYSPYGLEINFTSPGNNNDGIIRNNTFKLRPGFGFITTVDPSVSVTGNVDGNGNALALAPPAQTPPVFQNAGFESVAIANATYSSWALTNGTWTFRGHSGIATPGSGFNVPATNLMGRQAAFIQASGNISQHINLAAGSYRISFLGANRSSSLNSIKVLVDGIQAGSVITPASASRFDTYTTSAFTVAAGLHLVEFWGTSTDDVSVFLDEIRIEAAL